MPWRVYSRYRSSFQGGMGCELSLLAALTSTMSASEMDSQATRRLQGGATPAGFSGNIPATSLTLAGLKLGIGRARLTCAYAGASQLKARTHKARRPTMRSCCLLRIGDPHRVVGIDLSFRTEISSILKTARFDQRSQYVATYQTPPTGPVSKKRLWELPALRYQRRSFVKRPGRAGLLPLMRHLVPHLLAGILARRLTGWRRRTV